MNQKTLDYYRYIVFPSITWWATGYFLVDALHSFWHVKVAKKEPLWPDADSTKCPRNFCRYCGKGS